MLTASYTKEWAKDVYNYILRHSEKLLYLPDLSLLNTEAYRPDNVFAHCEGWIVGSGAAMNLTVTLLTPIGF